MPVDSKPIFRPEAIRPHLQKFALSDAVRAFKPRLEKWAALLESEEGLSRKETELLPNFIRDVFEELLGYVGPPGTPYTIKREALVKVDGKFADAGFGRFGGGDDRFVAVLEGKGPRDPMDRPFRNRKRSAVEQSLQYAVQLRIDWYLVTNLREIRLYHKAHDTFTFESFAVDRLATDEAELKRFVFLLGADRLLPATGGNHLDTLLTDSKRIGRELTNEFYKVYRQLRESAFRGLRDANPTHDPLKLLAATQKMLDRILFIAFCEDRDLLPREIIAKAYSHQDDFNPRPIWQNFIGLFRAVDKGNAKLDISRYNGGLFAPDDFLESLTVPDGVCEGFKTLADYEYGHTGDEDAKLIDVEILGHIFEQSISDLEELQKAVAADPSADADTVTEKAGPSKRKKEGAFYTPGFITRYIVAETLGPVLRDRFERLRAKHEADAKRTTAKVLADPTGFDPDELTEPKKKELVRFWEAWLTALEHIRIVDPSCGSGAFLIEAFEQMFAEYKKAMGYREQLAGKTIFDIQASILTKNLFGMDLNGEAVEIARLSCWIKTAELDKPLTSLDSNIIQGNSVVDPTGEHGPLKLWRDRFPAVFADGGFDVVIGNPPYVRQEWIKADKPYLEAHYKAFDGVADLYVYFYELGLTVLKPGGRLGFIVTNKWMKAGYGEALRKHYAEAAWVESVIDFGHAKQIFPDADVFPCIVVAKKPNAEPVPKSARVCIIPRDQLRVDDLSRQIEAEGVAVPLARFGPDAWNLEPPGVTKLMEKIREGRTVLKSQMGSSPFRGILTGFNEAYVLDTKTKDQILSQEPSATDLIRPYIRGQDVDRWRAEWAGMWMIAMKSSGNHKWPWSDAGENAESVFQKTYPLIHAHLNQFREKLINRQDQGEFWWELRACAYWDKFAAPKIFYQDITWNQRFSLDTAGTLCNNTVYFLPTDDPWLMAVMNAPIMWWFMWRTAQHGKDEALRLFTDYVNEFPIQTPSDDQRKRAVDLVEPLWKMAKETQENRQAVLDWLRMEFALDKPTQKLADVAGLSADELVAEVKKIRGRKLPLSVADIRRLKEEHTTSILPMQAKAREALTLETRLSDLVNEAYGLTPDEVALMWETAPPRMPIPAPGFC